MALFEQMRLLRESIEPFLEPVVIVHLVLLGLLLFGSTPALLEPFRRASRVHRIVLVGLVVVAGLVRVWIIPAWTSHVFDGHEADYFDVWRGVRNGPETGYRASEFIRLLYHWLGPLFGGSGRWLVVLNVLFSLLMIPLCWAWMRDLTGDESAGLWTAWFLAIDPILGFWSSSAYNVQQSFVLGLAALMALERAFRRGQTWTLAFGVTLWATSIAVRPEAALLAIPIGWRLVAHRRLVFSHLGWWLALLLPAGLVLLYVLLGQQTVVGGDGLEYAWQIFQRQVFFFDLMTPYHQWVPLAALAAAVVIVFRLARGSRGLLLFWAATFLSQHLPYAAFDDYGFRHTLVARLCLASVGGLACAVAWRQGRWSRGLGIGLWLALSVPLGAGVLDIASRYYASAGTFYRLEPRFSTAPALDLEPYRHCVFVAESDYFAGYFRASHFELFDDHKRAELKAQYHGCILFVFDRENFQASSRSIDGRALKVEKFFNLELLGKVVVPEQETYALVFRLGEKGGVR